MYTNADLVGIVYGLQMGPRWRVALLTARPMYASAMSRRAMAFSSEPIKGELINYMDMCVFA